MFKKLLKVQQLPESSTKVITPNTNGCVGAHKLMLCFVSHACSLGKKQHGLKLASKIFPTSLQDVKATKNHLATLKRIKIHLRNTMGQSRLNSLSVISIGRDLLKNCTNFKEEVMKKFINQKERRMNFTYKGEK